MNLGSFSSILPSFIELNLPLPCFIEYFSSLVELYMSLLSLI